YERHVVEAVTNACAAVSAEKDLVHEQLQAK
ncbi:MAG: hypothetical protein ACI867_002261, partial [Glaciecola sp.]